MKKIIIVFALLMLNKASGNTCTTFILQNEGNLVFGRNLDWYSDNGLVVVNKRNVRKTSLVFPPEKSIDWVSKYGSITFNQFGKEFPFGGINEKGLVIEIMVAPADYEHFDDRKAVNELQWIQYQLDNSATVEEVINSRKFLRISALDQELHFLICESSGTSAVIEFKSGSMIAYRDYGMPVKVLENDTYSTSLLKYKRNTDCRFTTAATMIKNYTGKTKQSVIDYSFEILDNVAISQEWAIVYDIKNMKIYFKTATNQKIKEIAVNRFNFDCKSETLIYDLLTENIGNINKQFVTFSPALNTEKLKSAISSAEIEMENKQLLKFLNYRKECNCLN